MLLKDTKNPDSDVTDNVIFISGVAEVGAPACAHTKWTVGWHIARA
jgi:hypothetical protein